MNSQEILTQLSLWQSELNSLLDSKGDSEMGDDRAGFLSAEIIKVSVWFMQNGYVEA